MTTKRSGPKAANAKSKYEPTSQERTAMANHRAREAISLGPRLKVPNDEFAEISTDHPDEAVGFALLMEALGTADVDFLTGLLGQLAKVGANGQQIDERALNFALSLVKGIKPKDQIETMLAAQMAAVHIETMRCARRLEYVENIPQQESVERAFNKLARTFATQMDALKRYRTGGEQKVTVQHVSVGEGGQAIVGNVTQAPAKTAPEKTAASTPVLTDSRTPAMTAVGKPTPAVVPFKRKSGK
jgi:hypothetical protein